VTSSHRGSLATPHRLGGHALREVCAGRERLLAGYRRTVSIAPLRDLAYLGGWKSVSTVVEVYQQPDDATMREAFESRRPTEAAQHG